MSRNTILQVRNRVVAIMKDGKRKILKDAEFVTECEMFIWNFRDDAEKGNDQVKELKIEKVWIRKADAWI